MLSLVQLANAACRVQFVSNAALRVPEEVFRPAAAGAPRSEAELSKEDRKRRRAAGKRAAKNRRAQKVRTSLRFGCSLWVSCDRRDNIYYSLHVCVVGI